MEKKNIMEIDRVLPENFDGVFRFTNWSDEEFVGIWGSKEYHFAPNSTSPMVMTDFSPVEVQQIRKHFAKKLAEREFFNTKNYKNLQKQERNSDGSPRLNSINQAGTYSLNDLAPLIQKALEPLPISNATVQETKKIKLEDNLSRDSEGELNTQAIKGDKDLEKMMRK